MATSRVAAVAVASSMAPEGSLCHTSSSQRHKPRPRPRGLQKLTGLQQLIRGTQVDFQDVESILSTLMLVAAIVLSIVVTLHTGTFSHDALVAGDVRHATFDHLRGKVLADDSYMRFLSGRILIDGYLAVSCSTFSLMFAATIYVSLVFSGARGDPDLFRRWWKVGRIWILLSLMPLMVSIVFFLKINHNAVYLVYPKYNWNANFTFISTEELLHETSTQQELLPETADSDALRRLAGGKKGGKAAAGTAGGDGAGDGGLVSHVPGGDDRPYGHDVAQVSKLFKLATSLSLGIGCVFMIAGHVWVTQCFQGPERQSSSSSVASNVDDLEQASLSLNPQSFVGQQGSEASTPCARYRSEALRESLAVELLKEQIDLLQEQNALMFQIFGRSRNLRELVAQPPEGDGPMLPQSSTSEGEDNSTLGFDEDLDIEGQVPSPPARKTSSTRMCAVV